MFAPDVFHLDPPKVTTSETIYNRIGEKHVNKKSPNFGKQQFNKSVGGNVFILPAFDTSIIT